MTTCTVVGILIGCAIATTLLVAWGWRAMNPFE